MKVLIRKELTSIFCSGTGLIFSLVFLITCGLMLWVFTGSFNILDSGYATTEKFFSLAPILLIILIPALTMRLIAEEKKNGTINLLRSRPFSISTIWISKWVASLLFVTLVILSTVVYIYTLYILGSPVGNIDLHIVIVSYLSLIGIASIFIGVGIFASSLTKNQIVAFAIALFLNLFIYYGFDLIGNLFQSGSLQALISSAGLYNHFSRMQRGVIEIQDIAILATYSIIFWMLTLAVFNPANKPLSKHIFFTTVCLTFVYAITFIFPFIRFDFTGDKRYTISEYSKNLMHEIAEGNNNIRINVFLEGNLNSGFQQLRDATEYMLNDLNRYADNKINTAYINPPMLSVSREKLPEYMAKQDMPGIVLNEIDRDGKLSQQLIYPYAQAIVDKDTIAIPLLRNITGNTAEENLNTSAENLEFQIIDALRLLLKNEEVNIAFIEGHDELPRAYVYDAEEALAKYFFVNRGQIDNYISILDDFRVVIIAGPTQKFSESEKYILDQYIMKGGRVLWLVDGAYISKDDLSNNGQSASMKNDTNLDNLLFTYGIRVEPNLIQDSQCSQIIVNTNNSTQPITIPWYYSPLLLPSPDNVITKNIADVKAEFVSSISLLNTSKPVVKRILLTSSNHSYIVQIPEMIDFDIQKIQSDPQYFNDSFLPTAVSLEGKFSSAFENRIAPDSVVLDGHQTLKESAYSKMVIVSSSDVIRNRITGQGEDTQIVPMGYDRISNRQYGNRDFIVNAVNWLANDDERISLHSKKRQMNLLDKRKILENRDTYTILNTLTPILFISLIVACVNIRRIRRYTK